MDEAATPTTTSTVTPTVTATAAPTATATAPATTTARPTATTTPPGSSVGLPGADFGPFTGGSSSSPPDSWIADVRTAGQDGYDRVVLEFTGGVPSYEVRYTDPPFAATSGRDVPVAGDAFLDVWLQGTSRVDLTGSSPVEHYTGPSRVRSDTAVVTEVVEVDDFEANVHWTIGLDDRRPLRVREFGDPARLVIDIAS
jgi:hypothetical protein